MADTCSEKMSFRTPVIVILGATGSGKSKLGIEIARKCCGEILSADSMQVYEGLNIVTNKVTQEERSQAVHHLLDVVKPTQRFTVLDFRNRALPIIDDLLKQKKIPIIVGGTNYYIESLLWKILIEDISFGNGSEYSGDEEKPCDMKNESASVRVFQCRSDTTKRVASVLEENELKEKENAVDSENSKCKCASDSEESKRHGNERTESYELVYERDKKRVNEDNLGGDNKRLKLDNEEINIMDEPALENIPSTRLYDLLKSIDPDRAEQLHPNNRRKIIRSLQVFTNMGRKHSEILQEQQSEEGGSELGGPLRYPHSCILWLQCKQEVLDKRLDSRVDSMLEQGLVQELLDFHKCYNEERLATNTPPDYTKGIFQSIGFKEFHDYLVLSPEDRQSEKGKKLFQAGVDALKLVTRRYARRQLRWITNRFLRRPARQVPPVYALDTTDPSVWDEHVLEPAIKIVESFLEDKKPVGIEPLPIMEKTENIMKTYHCEVCARVFVGDLQWNAHMASNKHKKMLKRKTKVS